MGGFAAAAARKERGDDQFNGASRTLARERSAAAQKNMPRPLTPANSGNNFKSFAAKVRHITNDGWDLIDAVYEVFCRARVAQADGMILESATWLADRGFGKPVQVGQLLDGEGNPVAFTLWNPAENKPIGDVVTLRDGKPVEEESSERYIPPEETMKPVIPATPTTRDSFAYGPGRPWGVGEAEPRKGE